MEVNKFAHHAHLQRIADADVQHVLKKDTSYGASWKASGGACAWHMIKRKIDRLMVFLAPLSEQDKSNLRIAAKLCPTAEHWAAGIEVDLADLLRRAADAEDIFALIAAAPDGGDGTVLAEVRDLRHYLLLVEAEMCARGVFGAQPNAPHPVQEEPAASVMKREMRVHEQNEQLNVVRSVSVPLEDSNKHAERITRDGMLRVGDRWTEWLPADEFLENRRYFSEEVRDMYVRVDDCFVLDRRRFPAEERKERFLALPMTVSGKTDRDRLPVWARAMYEPRVGVDNELQLSAPWREAWGPQ